MNGVAIDGKRQGFAHARVIHARLEDQRHQAHGRRGPEPAAILQARHFAEAELDDIGTPEVEVGHLFAGGASHIDFDRVQERAAAGGVIVGRKSGAMSAFPAGDGEGGEQVGDAGPGLRRVGGLHGIAEFHVEGAAVMGPGGGKGAQREEGTGQECYSTHRTPP